MINSMHLKKRFTCFVVVVQEQPLPAAHDAHVEDHTNVCSGKQTSVLHADHSHNCSLLPVCVYRCAVDRGSLQATLTLLPGTLFPVPWNPFLLLGGPYVEDSTEIVFDPACFS